MANTAIDLVTVDACNSNRASTFTVASSSSISSVILPQLDNSDAIVKNAEATQQILECQQAIKMISNQDIKNELSSKIEADPRCHHYSAKVSLASVARTDMKQYVDEHYCLASVKAARVFAAVFASDTIVILQDDKTKIGLGIPAVGRTFKTMQSINKPVTVEDHDFSKRIYLLIDTNDSNTTLQSGQLAIFIRPEYFVGTSSLTHIADLLNLVNDQDFVSVLLKENDVRPIWIILVDRGPDENPKHFKNIIDAYNSMERSMASLSEKLASITLPIDEYSMHLNSQGNVVDEELAQRNFEFSGNRLYELWSRDDIYAILIFGGSKEMFLPSIAKGMNGHYIDPIYALQYFNKLKIPQYDSSCPSILKEMYQRLCCNKCVDETVNLNFRVAEDIVDHDLLEDEISNSCE
ncbi:6654_t:CDS:2, partial [Gigaspora margarita]